MPEAVCIEFACCLPCFWKYSLSLNLHMTYCVTALFGSCTWIHSKTVHFNKTPTVSTTLSFSTNSSVTLLHMQFDFRIQFDSNKQSTLNREAIKGTSGEILFQWWWTLLSCLEIFPKIKGIFFFLGKHDQTKAKFLKKISERKFSIFHSESYMIKK